MKIKVFDPLYAQLTVVKDLISRNVDFEVLFTDSTTPPYILDFLTTNNIKHDFNANADLAVNQDDLLIPCTDIPVELIDILNKKVNNIYADADHCSFYKNDKSTYCESYTLDNIVYPCIAKLKKSYGGAKDVHIVQSKEELSLLNLDDKWFLQPFYDGTEYSVDFISVNGEHHLTAVWKYYKNKKFTSVLSKVEIVHDDVLKSKIYNKMSKVLTDIGKLNGATHSEIFIVNDEIKIVEINFRFHGHFTNKWQELATGLSHSYAFIDSIIEGKDIPKIYSNRETVYRISCNLEKEIPESIIDYSKIDNLPSIIHNFKHPSFNEDPTTYGPTTNMFNTLCFILMHKNEHYDNDIKVIEKWLKDLNSYQRT